MKLTVVNEIDFSSWFYYIEAGREFDNDIYKEAFGYKFTKKQLEKISKAAKNLESNRFLRVEH